MSQGGNLMRAIAIGTISITILVLVSVVTIRQAIGQTDSVCATVPAVATSTPSLIGDCETLLSVKGALRGTAPLNWWTGRSMTQWDGITVREGRVAEVSLAKRDLNGVIPAKVGDLSALKTLDLSSNSLTGHIPSKIGDLSALKTLDLSSNSLTGAIPSKLGDLFGLESLLLSSNSLSGQIPESFNGLTKLTRLRLSGNDFTGCMPANLLGVADGDAATLNLPTCGNVNLTPTTGERLITVEARLRDIEARLTAVETAVAQYEATPTPTATPTGSQ